MRQIIFLGTAAGMPIASSSTAILVEDETTNLLLDMSGGHNIFRALHEAGKCPLDITNIFISHHDSDHILGIVPLVRAFRTDDTAKERTAYCSRDTMAAIDAIFTHTARRHYDDARRNLQFKIVGDGEQAILGDWRVTFFDIGSTKTPQLGCAVTFPDGKRLGYLGDEPLSDRYLVVIKGCDVLLHEAFCIGEEIDRFKPYEKHHGTAREAGQNAVKADARLLALFHLEDETLDTRKEKYHADARASGYSGRILVPVDTDRLEF